MARATTTPAIRARIASSGEPAAVLAGRYGVTLDTIYRWRGRTSFEDRSHTAHQLATTLTRAQGIAAKSVEMQLARIDKAEDAATLAAERITHEASPVMRRSA